MKKKDKGVPLVSKGYDDSKCLVKIENKVWRCVRWSYFLKLFFNKVPGFCLAMLHFALEQKCVEHCLVKDAERR